MLKTRIILILSAAAMVAVLFSLPKVVVDNATENESIGASAEEESHEGHNHAPGEGHGEGQSAFVHGLEISEEDQGKINKFRNKIDFSSFNEKSLIFADSLAILFGKYSKYDSVARYSGLIAKNAPNEEHNERAGLDYYQAFSFATDRARAQYLGQECATLLQPILTAHPDRLDLKTKIAMTVIAGKSPMEGILMLRSVVEEDPENVEALYNLGMFSRETGQMDKAETRLKKLVEVDSLHIQGRLLYAITLIDLGKKSAAKEQLELLKKLDENEQFQMAVDNYLKNIE